MADHTTGRSMGKRLLFATAAVIALLQAAAFFYTHRYAVPAGTGGDVLTIYTSPPSLCSKKNIRSRWFW